jgi:hypothetical protein
MLATIFQMKKIVKMIKTNTFITTKGVLIRQVISLDFE